MSGRNDNCLPRESGHTLIRPFLSILIVLSVAAQTVYGAPAPRCSLSGRVTNAPPNGLVVKLKLASESALTTFDGYLAKIAPDGTFRFEGIAPGIYILIADAPGFLPSEYGATRQGLAGSPITLADGQIRKNLDLTLVPKTVVCGRVTDISGKPMANRFVEAYQKRTGIATLVNTGNAYVQTDGDGEFRFPDLPPGQFFISASSNWFPSAKSFNQAELIEVGEATGTARKTDIVVDESGYFVYHVRGEVAVPAQPYQGPLFVSLLETNPSGAEWPALGRTQLKPGEKFDLSGVRTKSYELVLADAYNLVHGADDWKLWRGLGGQPERFNILASQDIVLTGDVNDISLRLPPFASLKGHVELEGITPVEACPSRERTRVSISREADGEYQVKDVDQEGNFSVPYVVPGTYKVQLFPYRRGTVYVKSMLLDGKPANQGEITLPPSSSSDLTIVLSGDLANADGPLRPNQPPPLYLPPSMYSKASVSGRVRGAILPDLAIELWAIRYNSSSSYEYVVRPDKDGRFTFDAVDPGMYVLLARGPGYIPVEYGAKGPALEGTPITLVSGQQLKGIKLTAAPGRLICGKVTHDGDRPWANQPIWVFGSPQPWDSRSPRVASKSDVDGNFRVTNLLPGQYFIGVNTEPSTDHVRIYWRSTWSFAEAQPINNVGAASAADCQDDIRVPRQERPSHQVRGRLSGSARIKPQDRFYLQLSALNSAGSKAYSAVTQDIPIDSDFDIPGVSPGTYLIEVFRGPSANLSSPEVTTAAPLIGIPTSHSNKAGHRRGSGHKRCQCGRAGGVIPLRHVSV